MYALLLASTPLSAAKFDFQEHVARVMPEQADPLKVFNEEMPKMLKARTSKYVEYLKRNKKQSKMRRLATAPCAWEGKRPGVCDVDEDYYKQQVQAYMPSGYTKDYFYVIFSCAAFDESGCESSDACYWDSNEKFCYPNQKALIENQAEAYGFDVSKVNFGVTETNCGSKGLEYIESSYCYYDGVVNDCEAESCERADYTSVREIDGACVEQSACVPKNPQVCDSTCLLNRALGCADDFSYLDEMATDACNYTVDDSAAALRESVSCLSCDAYADYYYNSMICGRHYAAATCTAETDASCKYVCSGWYDSCQSVDNLDVDMSGYIADLIDSSCPASQYFNRRTSSASSQSSSYDGECTTTTTTTAAETTTTAKQCDRHYTSDDCSGDSRCFWTVTTSGYCSGVSDTVPSCGDNCDGYCSSRTVSGTWEDSDIFTANENIAMEYLHEVEAACHAETTEQACEAVAADVVEVPDALNGTDHVSVLASLLVVVSALFI